MTPTNNHSVAANNSNNSHASNSARQRGGGLMKRAQTLLIALLAVGVLAAGFMIVSGRAAGLGFHWPVRLAKIVPSQTTQAKSQEPSALKSQVKPLAPLAAKTWNNAGTDFNTTGNWTGGLPGSGDFAQFPAGTASVQPNVSANIAVLGVSFFTTTTTGYDLTSSSTAIQLLLNSVSASVGAQAINANNSTGTNTVDAPLVLNGAAASTQTFVQAGGGTLALNGVISSTNSVTLSLAGAGTFDLNGSNTYTGATSLNNSILVIGNDSALSSGILTTGNASATVIQAGGGTRTIPNSVVWGGNGTISGANNLIVNGSFTSSGAAGRAIIVNNSGLTTLSGNVFLATDNAAGTAGGLTVNGTGDLTISGVIANNSAANTTAKNVTVNTTAGTTTLSNANTYTGSTTLTAGTLVLGNKAAFGTGTVTWNGVNTSANTDLSGANAIPNTGAFNATGNIFTGSNNLELSGALTNSVPANTITNNLSSGTLTFSNTFNLSNSGTARTVTLGGTGNTAVSGVIANGGGSTSNLSKSGAGTLTLSNANTYTGTTTINGGTLLVNGSTAASAVTVNSTGTLGGTGTVNGSVSVSSGGFVAPGNSPGILNTGAVTFSSGSTFSVEIGGTTPGNTATDYDQLNVTGSVSLNGATLTPTQFAGFVPVAGNAFTIINNDLSDPITTTFAGLAEGATISNFLGSGLNATISYVGGDGNDVVILIPPTISIGDASLSESGGNMIFTVTQSAASGVNTTFQYSTADVTATAGSDYTGATNAPGQITAGNTTTTISIPILPDAIYEGDETFTVTLNTPVNATILTGTGTGTIIDDDAIPGTLVVTNTSDNNGA